MREIHDFNKSRERGDLGELIWPETYPDIFKIYKPNKYDLDVIPNGKSFEIKTEDGYTLKPDYPKPHKKKPKSTVNFFIETISNKHRLTIGGPFKSLKDNVDWYGHYFPHEWDQILFLFTDVKVLCERSEALIGALPSWKRNNPTPVYNRGHITLGYALPIESFSDLFVKIKLGDDIEMYL